MGDFISLAFLLFAVVTFVVNRREKARKKQQEPRRRANPAGDDGRFDRAAQRVNSVGDDSRLDREAQKANSIGESRRRRMVEEQRAKAEAYRRAHGEAAVTSADADEVAEQKRPDRQSRPSGRPACPACGRPLKPGVKFCPGCGAVTSAAAAVTASNNPAEAGLFATGAAEAAYSYSDGDRPPTEISPALSPLPKARPALTLPGFSGPELTRALVMAEILGPCKARQHH